MNSIYKKFGDRVKSLRKSKELSQEELAELVKTDVRTIVAIEGGDRNPTLKTIYKISLAFKISLSELFNF